MSLSEVVDHGYRLRPEDLGGRTHRVTIANVTYQGIEEMTPVLHFAGQPKPLSLSPEMAQQLTTITNTSLRSAWVGREILLAPQIGPDGPIIVLRATDAVRWGVQTRRMERAAGESSGWRMALAIVAALIIAASVYTIVYLPQLQSTVNELLNLFQ